MRRGTWTDFNEEDFLYKGKQAVASRRLNQALVKGTIKKEFVCLVCGNEGKTVAHHYKGYDFPFNVWWVCYKCNANIPHDQEYTLEEVRGFLKEKYIERFEKRLNWRERYTYIYESCSVCGVYDLLENMAIVVDEYMQAREVYCHRCVA